LRNIAWRTLRPYFLAEKYENNDSNGILKVYGFLRGKNLNVNNLVHIPGVGDFQIHRVCLFFV